MSALQWRGRSKKRNRRKVGAENSLTRSAFLDAAENLLRDEGYAAVTTRRLAKRAGLRPQLVHYYFRSMDDLLVALWQRVADRNLQIHLREMASGRALRAIWECNRDARDTTLTLEFLALARHRARLRREIAREGERFREKTVELLSKELPEPALKRAWPVRDARRRCAFTDIETAKQVIDRSRAERQFLSSKRTRNA